MKKKPDYNKYFRCASCQYLVNNKSKERWAGYGSKAPKQVSSMRVCKDCFEIWKLGKKTIYSIGLGLERTGEAPAWKIAGQPCDSFDSKRKPKSE